jgi:hypothetical protein
LAAPRQAQFHTVKSLKNDGCVEKLFHIFSADGRLLFGEALNSKRERTVKKMQPGCSTIAQGRIPSIKSLQK